MNGLTVPIAENNKPTNRLSCRLGASETNYHQSAQLDYLIEQADGFALVYPEHKFHLVSVLQQHGQIVCITGDGVNGALSVAGRMTIFAMRTRGPFWSIRPAWILLGAVLGTQAIATLIAVYGLFMTPIGWKLAVQVWAYAGVCFLINDRLKLFAYRSFDPNRSSMLVKPGSGN